MHVLIVFKPQYFELTGPPYVNEKVQSMFSLLITEWDGERWEVLIKCNTSRVFTWTTLLDKFEKTTTVLFFSWGQFSLDWSPVPRRSSSQLKVQLTAPGGQSRQRWTARPRSSPSLTKLSSKKWMGQIWRVSLPYLGPHPETKPQAAEGNTFKRCDQGSILLCPSALAEWQLKQTPSGMLQPIPVFKTPETVHYHAAAVQLH